MGFEDQYDPAQQPIDRAEYEAYELKEQQTLMANEKLRHYNLLIQTAAEQTDLVESITAVFENPAMETLSDHAAFLNKAVIAAAILMLDVEGKSVVTKAAQLIKTEREQKAATKKTAFDFLSDDAEVRQKQKPGPKSRSVPVAPTAPTATELPKSVEGAESPLMTSHAGGIKVVSVPIVSGSNNIESPQLSGPVSNAVDTSKSQENVATDPKCAEGVELNSAPDADTTATPPVSDATSLGGNAGDKPGKSQDSAPLAVHPLVASKMGGSRKGSGAQSVASAPSSSIWDHAVAKKE